MFDGLFIASLIGTCIQLIKEVNAPVIPTENWSNKELYHKDIVDGVSIEERMKSLKNGKYKLTEVYPEPHRGTDGRIVIENSQLYYDDMKKYSAYQVQKWVNQGKYNLDKEELRKENERINKQLEYLCNL